jgi:hypothetical protein
MDGDGGYTLEEIYDAMQAGADDEPDELELSDYIDADEGRDEWPPICANCEKPASSVGRLDWYPCADGRERILCGDCVEEEKKREES